MWHDIAIETGSSFPKKVLEVMIKGQKTEVIIQKNYCSGVKRCSGDACSFATSNRHRENRCLRHHDSALERTGKCPF